MSKSPTRELTFRYFIVLAVLIVTVLGNFTLFSAYEKEQISAAAEINLAGRQRMLSQRISLLAINNAVVTNPSAAQANYDEVNFLIESFFISHTALMYGSEELGTQVPKSQALQNLYFGINDPLDRKVNVFFEHVTQLLDNGFTEIDPIREKTRFFEKEQKSSGSFG